MLGFFKRRRRARVRRRPVPPAWRRIAEDNLPFLQRLSPEEQELLWGHVQVFLDEKRFEGAGGLEVDEEIRVTVALQACLLLLHRPDSDYFPGLGTILVYPSTYAAPAGRLLPGGVVQGSIPRLGESWQQGSVVLAWDAVLRGAADPMDGQNLVLHEFAHQLDQDPDTLDEVPELRSRSRFAAFARVLGREFREHARAVAAQRPTLLDPYGAENPAEFFAVATEMFFERPRALRRRHPELYEELRVFYRLDPAAPPRSPAPADGPGRNGPAERES